MRQLRYFVSIARLQSMTRAAEALFIAQPALSMQMRNLEEELGVQLLSRHSRGVALTEAGQVFLEKALRITRDVAAAKRIGAEEPAGSAPLVRLGINPSLDADLIARVLRGANLAMAGTKITILEGASDQLAEWLLDATLDMAIVHFLPDDADELTCDTLFSDEIVLLTDRTRPPGPAISFAELTRIPLMLQPKPHKVRSLIDAAAAAIGETMLIPFEIRSVHMIIDLVERGIAAAILPRTAATRAVREGRINVTPIVDPSLGLEVSLAYRERGPYSESEIVLRRLVRRATSGAAML